jgi:hypothetical protein
VIKIGSVSKYLSEPPTEKQLVGLTVDELIAVARNRVSRTKPFKRGLIEYIMGRGKGIF